MSDSPVTIYKSADGTLKWIAVYSNRFLDDDYPADIISSDAHRNFAKAVRDGVVPKPELWIFHNRNWRIGKAEWVAYDEAGFAMAGGEFFDFAVPVADALVKKGSELAVSHGMPVQFIEREDEDKRVITSYVSIEISVVPKVAAANPWTTFFVDTRRRDDDMAIPDETKRELVDQMGVDPSILSGIESHNAQIAQTLDTAQHPSKAKDEIVLETKEVDGQGDATEVEAQAVPEEKSVEELPADVEKGNTPEDKKADMSDEEDDAIVEDTAKSKEDVDAAVITQALGDIVKTLGHVAEQQTKMAERIHVLEAELEKQRAANEQREKDKFGNIDISALPIAAQAAQLAKSVVGREEAREDGRSALAKSKPEETKSTKSSRTGIPFVDQLLNGDVK